MALYGHIHHRVSDYARAINSRAYKVVKVENPFATGLDDIQRSSALSKLNSSLTRSVCDLTPAKFNKAPAFHRRLPVEHDAMLPSVRIGGNSRKTSQPN